MTGLEALIMNCAPEVAPATMMAIIKVESNGNPWVIGNNTLKSSIKPAPKTKEEAISVAKHYLSLGHSLDMGLAQINSVNLKWLGLSVDQVFDPCTNIKAGAYILKGFYLRASEKYGDGQKALMHALSGYNTGSLYRGQTYVNKVVRAANNGIKVNVPSIAKSHPPSHQDSQQSRTPTASPNPRSAILVSDSKSPSILR